tara:strand:- start:393 stop:1232 length:840 start_codon:yes stop_codon:yes gene_type:complete
MRPKTHFKDKERKENRKKKNKRSKLKRRKRKKKYKNKSCINSFYEEYEIKYNYFPIKNFADHAYLLWESGFISLFDPFSEMSNYSEKLQTFLDDIYIDYRSIEYLTNRYRQQLKEMAESFYLQYYPHYEIIDLWDSFQKFSGNNSIYDIYDYLYENLNIDLFVNKNLSQKEVFLETTNRTKEYKNKMLVLLQIKFGSIFIINSMLNKLVGLDFVTKIIFSYLSYNDSIDIYIHNCQRYNYGIDFYLLRHPILKIKISNDKCLTECKICEHFNTREDWDY